MALFLNKRLARIAQHKIVRIVQETVQNINGFENCRGLGGSPNHLIYLYARPH